MMSAKRQPAAKMLFMAAAISAAIFTTSTPAYAADPIRIAYIDPLSGPFATAGDIALRHFMYLADRIKSDGNVLGREIKIVPFDNKGSAQESLQILQEVADRGIHYITQGLGSHVSAALIEGVDKYNRRHPDNKIVFLNYAGQDPALTNSSCSFWHFAFEASVPMKAGVITDYIANHSSMDKVFLINQDYGFGHSMAKISKRMLAEKAPDVEIVGNIFHPIGRVKDFSPYAMEIKRSGADAVITGNWGNDLALLVKAGANMDLDVKWFTQAAAGPGVPSGIGKAGEGKVFLAADYYSDLPTDEQASAELRSLIEGFETQYNYDWYFMRMVPLMRMWTAAIEEVGTTNPTRVAKALEGMSYETSTGVVRMRKDNHQLLQPLYLSKFKEDAETSLEGTGMGFTLVKEVPAKETALPTTCSMNRSPD